MAIRIQAQTQCGYLRQVAAGAISTASTLKDSFVALQAQIFSPTFQKGRIVVSQSGSGQSGSFQINGGGAGWTQDNIFGLCEQFLQMLESADPILLPDDASPASTEALRSAIAANVMLGNIPQTVTAVGGDFTLLYIPVFGTGVST